MVTKKRKASRPKTRTVYRTAPRKAYRKKSGVTMIPSAAATVALAAVNYDGVKKAYNYVTTSSQKGIVGGVRNLAMGSGSGAKAARSALIGKDALIKDAVAVAGGYLAGELVKKYAPSVIKSPMGKLAKKIPKVI